MVNKWKWLLWAVLSVFLLTACSIQSVEEYEKMDEQERSVEELAKERMPHQEENEKAPEKPIVPELVEEKQAKEVTEKPEENQVEEKASSEEGEAKKETLQPELKVEPKQEQVAEQKAEEKVQQLAPIKSTEEEPAPKPVVKKREVTIAIYVHSLRENMDLLHPSLQSEKYVPANGVILKPTRYELLADKDSVWDILQRAAKEHTIQLEYQGANENAYNSVYIEGINHLYEFSAGPLSGWMYQVNGAYPNYGASQYELADGDVIEWHYTIDLGRDLGQQWQGES